jgi:CRP/FNR family cyclic AMP-dependent transcriptional regulator
MVKASQLAHAALFEGFEERELEEIARLATERSYADGATVLSQGDLGRDLFVILEGQVDIVRELAGGERELVARYGPGDFFGERAALMTGSRTASVVARCALSCAVLTQWDVLAVLRDDRARAVRFLQRLRERYVRAQPRPGR